MAGKKKKRDPDTFEDEVLAQLIEDPTRSIREIAAQLDSYRQKVWRKKKKFEENETVWGYTAVVDEEKLNHVVYLLLLKMRPMDKDLADLIINRVIHREYFRQKVRPINVLYVNGEYDWVIMFAAPDHATARRYYDSLRIAYDRYLLEKPIMVDVNFTLIREGKINPHLNDLYDFVPV